MDVMDALQFYHLRFIGKDIYIYIEQYIMILYNFIIGRTFIHLMLN